MVGETVMTLPLTLAILTPCSRARFGSADQSRTRPPTRELI
jgi:hypothetical protein